MEKQNQKESFVTENSNNETSVTNNDHNNKQVVKMGSLSELSYIIFFIPKQLSVIFVIFAIVSFIVTVILIYFVVECFLLMNNPAYVSGTAAIGLALLIYGSILGSVSIVCGILGLMSAFRWSRWLSIISLFPYFIIIVILAIIYII